MDIYVVKAGDSVDSIAAFWGISADELIYANQLEFPYRLAVGQALYVPGEGRGTEALYSFGYVYPFVDKAVLDETLTFVTDIYVFTYGFTMEGNLVPPKEDDTWLIASAKEAGVRPVMVLAPMDEDGRFNSALVTAVVENPAVRERLIWQTGGMIQEKGYGGLDIDFEYVQAKDREGYAAFVAQIRHVMNLFGYPVTAALAPKLSASQPGILYEGIDYGLLGDAADRVMLMTYEWGYTYGPPMAVAPVDQVRRVVEYAVSAIPREKISLGIPNYGYDWPLPFVRGTTRAESISNLEAVRRAVFYGAEIQFDETAMAPYFTYWQYGIQHVVWFEDARSIKAKFDLIREFGLTGAGYWQLMSFFRANWLLMEEMFRIERR